MAFQNIFTSGDQITSGAVETAIPAFTGGRIDEIDTHMMVLNVKVISESSSREHPNQR